MELQPHTNTLPPPIDPSCSLHNAAHHLLDWIGTPKTMVQKKVQKCGNTRSPCLDKPVLGHCGLGWGGGGGYTKRAQQIPRGCLPRARTTILVITCA